MNPDDDIPDELTSVCWCDGANTQLVAIISEDNQKMDEINKIPTNKHSVSRTSVEQGCDRCPVFRTVKKKSRSMTMDRAPNTGIKRQINLEYRWLSADGVLKLSSTKTTALIDFLSCYPTFLSV